MTVPYTNGSAEFFRDRFQCSKTEKRSRTYGGSARIGTNCHTAAGVSVMILPQSSVIRRGDNIARLIRLPPDGGCVCDCRSAILPRRCAIIDLRDLLGTSLAISLPWAAKHRTDRLHTFDASPASTARMS